MSIGTAVSLIRDRLVSGGIVPVLIAVTFVAIVAIVAMLALSVLKRRSREVEELLESKAEEPGRAAGLWPLAVAVMVLLAAAVGGTAYLGRTDVCLRCHDRSRYAGTLEQSVHAGIGCSRCHAPSGVFGAAKQGVTNVRWIVVYGTQKRSPDPLRAPIDDGACLRCHPHVTNGIVTSNGIRVRHADFLEAGSRCQDCHAATAHTVKRPTRPRMDACLICHDGRTASSDCEECHVQDVAYTPAVKRGFSKLKTAGAPDSCYVCHDERPCLRCHGLRMPHPAGWAPTREDLHAAKHAREGFANRTVCWRCHFGSGSALRPGEDACAPCHGRVPGYFHGGAAWVREHGLQATGQRSGPYNQCFFCHDTGLCDLCHPPSYRQRYNPSGAAPVSPDYHPPEWPE